MMFHVFNIIHILLLPILVIYFKFEHIGPGNARLNLDNHFNVLKSQQIHREDNSTSPHDPLPLHNPDPEALFLCPCPLLDQKI